MAPAGEHVDLVGDPRARGVHQIKEGDADAARGFLDPDDLLNRASAPAAGFHCRIVGHHRHLAAIDHPESRYDAIRREFLGEHVGEQAVFDEGALVEQQVKALAGRELVLLTKLWQVAGATLQRLFAKLALP